MLMRAARGLSLPKGDGMGAGKSLEIGKFLRQKKCYLFASTLGRVA